MRTRRTKELSGAVLWIGFLIFLIGFGGWIANIVKVVGLIDESVTTMFILRCVGIVFAPLGAVLGFM